jgi:hypothetical protein
VADGLGGYRTYAINYDNGPVVPHITSIVNSIGTGESYTFAVLGLQPLVSPFDGSFQGSANYLRSVTMNGLGLVHQFEINGSAELTKVTFPYGGSLRWDYGNQTYAGGRMQREISRRYVSKDGTAASERAYVVGYNPEDVGRTSHSWTVIDDINDGSEKAWWFEPDATRFDFGLVLGQEDRPHPWPNTAGGRRQEYTWTTDASGRPYIAAVVITEDINNPAQVQRKIEQTRDAYGNLTQTKLYAYGNLTTPARTYTNMYVSDANYTSRYIRDRLLSSTVKTEPHQWRW